MLEADVSKVFAAGLEIRPLADTVRDTLAQAATVDGVGLDPARERRLLAEARAAGGDALRVEHDG
jgi:hypothetical protein